MQFYEEGRQTPNVWLKRTEHWVFTQEMLKSKFIPGLLLLAKHFKKPDGHHIAAEHDKVIVYATDSELSQNEVKQMIEFGWFQETEEEEFTAKQYDADNDWMIYV